MLTYEQFEKYIEAIRSNYHRLNEIGEVLRWDDVFELSMAGDVIGLLEHIFRDKDEWISYWVYEKDFGLDWEEGCAIEADGTDIDLSTTEKLYDFLISNMK